MSRPIAVPDGWGNPEIETAARKLLDAGLGQGMSTIEPGTDAWAPAVAADLRHRIIDNADAGEGGFVGKLQAQLAGASRATYLLAAELLYVQVAPLSNVKGDTKRARISTVLSWLTPSAKIPPELDTPLSTSGVFNGGVGFHVQIWQQIGWLLSFVEHWWQLPAVDRERALHDPWAFWDVVAEVPTGQVGMRNSLLYLMFPATFSPIVNQVHKRDIRNAFAELIGGASGNDAISIDRDLLAIRQRHQKDSGQIVDWYDEPFASQWQKLADEGQRAWLVRPRPGGGELVARWQDESFVSLAANHLGDVPGGADRNAIRAAVENGYQHLDYAQRLSLATEYHSFLSTMKDDDLVATVVDDHLHVGVVTGPPEYTGLADARLWRSVAWTGAPPASLGDLPAPLPEGLAQQGTVVDLTEALPVLSQLVSREADLPTEDAIAPDPPIVAGPLTLRPATASLGAAVHADVAWLQEIIDLLGARRQIVLYGPPGTGKTYLARALAHHLTDPDAVRLVQFHPSYAYEDFFEGFRPTKAPDGSVGFALHPGPLRALAAEARADRTRPYILIIDEINRANLAKVLGELYFLLEYRSDSILLQYSPAESFSLPPNVFLIGTMNTADRSIALVDAAMRRRFAFVEMHPEEEPVSGLLPRWLATNGKADDERAGLLAALNAEIGEEDRDYKIGPSYLMTPDVEESGGLERVWAYSILPLLEEHYYGRLSRAQVRERFGLAAVRRRAATQEPTGP
ncbi:MAG: McrB family protein [Dehalococcoidia bacterium]